MNTLDKDNIFVQTRRRNMAIRIKCGAKAMFASPLKLAIFIAYFPVMLLIKAVYTEFYCHNGKTIAERFILNFSPYYYPIIIIAGALLIIIIFGLSISAENMKNEFLRIGLNNKAGEAPVLISKRKDKTNPLVTVYEFDGAGIPVSEWNDKKESIEAILNIYITKIKMGKNKRSVLLYAVSSDSGLPDFIKWNDKYMVKDSSTLVLGKGIAEPVTVNLAKIPHVLLGGSTGSGKSVLLKLLLMQAIKKNIVVTIADFKGGVDFPPIWHKKCNIFTDEEELLQILTALVEALKSRKLILKESGCANIDEYNKKTGNSLQRFIFACDEIAEVLDKTGLTKEQKELVTKIENKLSVIARQGRAFGIHLILATQRPDANILSGQIRNNINCRACGRADTVLSQIILDSPAAAEQIPKDAAGRFILHDETVFQAYIFDETKF